MINSLQILQFFLFIITTISLWIKKDIKIWGPLLTLSLGLGLYNQTINILGLGLIGLGWIGFYMFYKKRNFVLFLSLISLILSFPLRLVQGFNPIVITPKFSLNFSGISLGLIPLVLGIYLAKTKQDWKKVFKGLFFGFLGIGLIAILATVAKATRWEMKIPSFFTIRLLSNLFLSCIAQEALYRGFIQEKLGIYFSKFRQGPFLSIILSSSVFTLAHFYWNPSATLGLFIFIAGLLYGYVYLRTKKIEAAILTHFSLNLIHMLFFNYHAA